MSIKKYRMCLAVLIVLAIVIGILSYFAEQDKTYRDGMLVWNECVLEEDVA